MLEFKSMSYMAYLTSPLATGNRQGDLLNRIATRPAAERCLNELELSGKYYAERVSASIFDVRKGEPAIDDSDENFHLLSASARVKHSEECSVIGFPVYSLERSGTWVRLILQYCRG